MAVDKPKLSPGRTYTCWECHTSGFEVSELVGHRCSGCRADRTRAATDGGRFSPYTLAGAKVWKTSGEGSREGLLWKRRKRTLSDENAKQALLRTNEKRMARESPE